MCKLCPGAFVKLETTQLAVTASAVSSPVRSVSTVTSNPVSALQSPLQSPYNGQHSRHNSSTATVQSPHMALSRHASAAGKLMLLSCESIAVHTVAVHRFTQTAMIELCNKLWLSGNLKIAQSIAS
jgi:hypothetical protein